MPCIVVTLILVVVFDSLLRLLLRSVDPTHR